MNGYGRIAELGLRSGRGQYERAVLDVVQRTIGFFVLNLDVRKPCAVECTVVNQSLAAVNQLLFPHLLEGSESQADDFFVERKRVAAPIKTPAQSAQLVLELAAVLHDKLQDSGI